jgi:hypothetical protein
MKNEKYKKTLQISVNHTIWDCGFGIADFGFENRSPRVSKGGNTADNG